MSAITERGGEVESAREMRPSFDAVFATLVEREQQERQAAIEAANHADGEAA